MAAAQGNGWMLVKERKEVAVDNLQGIGPRRVTGEQPPVEPPPAQGWGAVTKLAAVVGSMLVGGVIAASVLVGAYMQRVDSAPVALDRHVAEAELRAKVVDAKLDSTHADVQALKVNEAGLAGELRTINALLPRIEQTLERMDRSNADAHQRIWSAIQGRGPR